MADSFSIRTSRGKKYVCVDFSKLTPNEREIVKMYMEIGYIVKEKKQGWTHEKMRMYIVNQSDKEGLQEFDSKIDNKENFITIMAWFKKRYLKEQKK